MLLAQAFAAALPADREGLIVNIIDQRVWRLDPAVLQLHPDQGGAVGGDPDAGPGARARASGSTPSARARPCASVHQTPDDSPPRPPPRRSSGPSTPDEIAARLRYLIDAPSVTGQMIAVDGGQHLAWRTPDVIG